MQNQDDRPTRLFTQLPWKPIENIERNIWWSNIPMKCSLAEKKWLAIKLRKIYQLLGVSRL